MTDTELFKDRIIPIMDKVARELREKQVEEYRKEAFSIRSLLAGAAGPDGGMAADSTVYQNLRINGEWNSKTVEDYIAMVKDELGKQQINATPEIEQMMIDKMVKDQMPKSSIEYIMKKAAGNSLFSLAEQAIKSPLQKEIESRGEQMYSPSGLEKGIGWGLGAAADFLAMGGTGIVSGLGYIGTDIAINAVTDNMEKQHVQDRSTDQVAKESDIHIPLVLRPEEQQRWIDEQKRKTETTIQQIQEKPDSITQENEIKEEAKIVPSATEPTETQTELTATAVNEHEEKSVQTNINGWQGILSGLGLSGLSDIGRNAGYILAMLPDMLLGIFTGKTQSLGLKDNMIPIASVIAGMFVKNPLLKMTLIGLGGANLINKAGHEQLAKVGGASISQSSVAYLQYGKEIQNSRIRDTQIEGKTLIATIDNIPVTINLPDKVVDAYRQGALPMSTLANAVLQRCDQMQQISQAQERFEQQAHEATRTISQR